MVGQVEMGAMPDGAGLLADFTRKLCDDAAMQGDAVSGPGADRAGRIGRGADGGTKVEEGLSEVSGARPGEGLGGSGDRGFGRG